MTNDYIKSIGEERLSKTLPLGLFCYGINCRSSRIFIGAIETNTLENITVQEKICAENCKAYKLRSYQQGKKISREYRAYASNVD